MANSLVNMTMIAQESLLLLENYLGFTKKVNKDYDSSFGVSGAKIGTVVNARMPVQYLVSTGQALDLQDTKETTVPVRLDTQNHVDFQFSSQDLALDIDRFSERYLKNAVAALANKVDQNGLAAMTKKVAQHVGTPGTTPSSLLTFLQAKSKLDKVAVPKTPRYCLVDSTSEITLVNALTSIFNPVTQASKQYLEGEMGRAAGMTFFADQNVYTHTTGTIASSSTPLTNGTTADGATSIVTNGWNSSACTIKEGDVIGIAGVYEVNPMSKQSTGQLKQFVVTATGTDSSGDLTIPISPSIILSGPYKNCWYSSDSTVTIASGLAIYFFDATGNAAITAIDAKASPQNLVFHPDFCTLACADLPLPGGEDMAARASDKQLGLSVRVVRQYDIQTDQWPCRLDILYGWSILRPELACRVSA